MFCRCFTQFRQAFIVLVLAFRCSIWRKSMGGEGTECKAVVRKFIVSQAKLSLQRRAARSFFKINFSGEIPRKPQTGCKIAATAAVVACSTNNGEERGQSCMNGEERYSQNNCKRRQLRTWRTTWVQGYRSCMREAESADCACEIGDLEIIIQSN